MVVREDVCKADLLVMDNLRAATTGSADVQKILKEKYVVYISS